MAWVLFGILSLATTFFSEIGSVKTIQGQDYQTTLDHKAGHTIVRVYSGFGYGLDGSNNWGGNRPGITLWDELGRYIGHVPGSKAEIAENAMADIVVTHYKTMIGVNAAYISISDGGNNALCVAQIDIKFPDDTSHSWNGDMAHFCSEDIGARTYASQHRIGKEQLSPYCVWIDRDRTNGIPSQGFHWHIPSFHPTSGRINQTTYYPDTLCRSRPRFSMYPNMRVGTNVDAYSPPLQFAPDFSDVDLNAVRNPRTKLTRHHPERRWYEPVTERVTDFFTRRQAPRPDLAADFVDSVARVRNGPISARDICMAPKTFGPNYLSLFDGLFCDTTTHTLYPVCDKNADEEEEDTCYDPEEEELRYYEEDDDDDDSSLAARTVDSPSLLQPMRHGAALPPVRNSNLPGSSLSTLTTRATGDKKPGQKKQKKKTVVHKYAKTMEWGI